MILVTGGTGYVGSHVVRRLFKLGLPVRALIRNRDRARKEGRLRGLPIELIEGDVTQAASLKSAINGARAIIHTVAIAVEKGEATYEAVNYEGTVNMVEAAKKAGVRRFINISQLGASPELPYRFLASKGRAQSYLTDTDLEWTAFRPSVIWGPEDEFANTFARLSRVTPLIFPIVGYKNSKFQPVWVEDVATCIVNALDDPATVGKEFELGGPEILTLEEIERRTLDAAGSRRLMVRFPMALLRVLVSLMEKLLPNPPVTRSLLELLAVSNVTTANAIHEFVSDPLPFTPENAAPYMRQFKVRDTVTQLLGK